MQSAAMRTTDRTLLVSAAAGSGKTATLTERIIRQVLDKENPVSISDMLVVTFTNAAVGELRERISSALTDALSRDPENHELTRQLMLLPSARISTIDSFCSEILRANCERVGVPHGYRIADGAEAELLTDSMLDGLLDTLYEDKLPDVATAEEVDELCRCLTDSGAQGDLAANIRFIYRKTLDTEEGVGLLAKLASQFDPAFYECPEKTVHGSYAMGRVKEAVGHYLPILRQYLDTLISCGDKKQEKRIETLEIDIAYLTRLASADSYDDVRNVLCEADLPANPMAGAKGCPVPFTALRNKMKDAIEKLRKEFFIHSPELFRHTYAELYRTLSVLCRIVECFHRAFMAEKLRRGALQYSDVTRLTYECLWQNGAPTDVARGQAEQYAAIYVDEYQDVNAIQHRIFEAISRPDNRFMVGDIKQSIYGFRSADPTVFASMKDSFPLLGGEGDSPSATIFMSENFRCDRAIIDFVNLIFDKIFSLIPQSIGYKDDDRLVAAKKYDGSEPEYVRPSVCLVPNKKKRISVDGEEREVNLAALTVAEKIKELLDCGRLNDGTPVRPEHIAIILRNARGHDVQYAAALASLGIPATAPVQGPFFLSPEILLTMCVLYTIDNPTKDVYLAGALASPFGGFTADDLTLVRRAGGDSLYSSLLRYTDENPDFEKGREFLKRLERYRLISEGVTVDALLALLYRETDLLSLASAGGGRDNMMRLFEHARRFEKSSYRGLYNFLNYIEGIIDRRNEFEDTAATDGESAVRIITAHSSKGLEFPIVFFADAETPFKNKMDTAPRLLIDEKFGMGMKLRGEGGLGLVDNLTGHVVADARYRKKIEEEARVLYVILTRARERLFVVASPGSDPEKYKERVRVEREWLDAYSVYSLGCYLDMICYTTDTTPLSPSELLSEPPEYLTDEGLASLCNEPEAADEENGAEVAPSAEADEEIAGDAPENTELYSALMKGFTYEYPNKYLTELPEKLSVSRLYPEVLDGSLDNAEIFAPDASKGGRLVLPRMGVLPDFYSGKKRNDATARGIATHLLLQFCDLDALVRNGAEAELARLVSERFISERDAALVRLDEVELFRSSQLLSDMRSASRLWRELRFNVRLPASIFTEERERGAALADKEILVQGVIDCIIEDEEGALHLVDYKTDRLTRAELDDRSLAAEKLRAAHSLQLSYYSLAIEKMFGKRPVTVEVYSMPLGETVDVSANEENKG